MKAGFSWRLAARAAVALIINNCHGHLPGGGVLRSTNGGDRLRRTYNNFTWTLFFLTQKALCMFGLWPRQPIIRCACISRYLEQITKNDAHTRHYWNGDNGPLINKTKRSWSVSCVDLTLATQTNSHIHRDTRARQRYIYNKQALVKFERHCKTSTSIIIIIIVIIIFFLPRWFYALRSVH